MTIGTALLSLCLLGNGLSSTFWAKQPVDASGTPINPNLAIGQAGVAFNFLFGVVYSFTYTPLQGVYPTENLETTARAKGLALSGVIVSLVGFINTYAGPYALQNMKNNVSSAVLLMRWGGPLTTHTMAVHICVCRSRYCFRRLLVLFRCR